MMPRKMPASVLAQIVRERFQEGGPEAAGECLAIIERLHGRRKVDEVWVELELIFAAERDAREARKPLVMFH
jgi:hypothetical protein